MPGPLPKDPKLRQRRNKSSTAAKLSADSVAQLVPSLPDRRPDNRRKWHPLTLERWNLVWTSPMASEYLRSDVPGLRDLALLWDEYVREPRPALAAEIRLQEQRFGLSPIDRRRLQWEVERAEGRRGDDRPTRTKRVRDPRDLFQVLEGGKS